jgi:5-oxoprolinase (ATP-hydrolysing) subunit A
LHEAVYRARGHHFVAEYYADLEYSDQGNVIITQVHDPVDATDAAARCVRAIREGVTRSTGGIDVPTGADSICVHSDTPNAVEVARAVRTAILPLAA